ncbi:MAG: rRNA maturation RNase YbeY [Ruminococcaceae bacterium]|nr:rRNA maturation RNase YbeY [Oscillospiraceae bacterium]
MELKINIENEQEIKKVNKDLESLLHSVVKKALEYENIEENCEVNILLTDNESIREINNDQRNIDSATDVLSFPYLMTEDGELLVSEEDYYDGYLQIGDIVISLERAQEQSEEFGHSYEREVGFLTCHSVLHLLGYDHEEESDREIMRQKEEAVLELLSLTR